MTVHLLSTRERLEDEEGRSRMVELLETVSGDRGISGMRSRLFLLNCRRCDDQFGGLAWPDTPEETLRDAITAV